MPLPRYPGLVALGAKFARAFVDVARKVGLDPAWLATVVDFETGGQWSASEKNPYSGAVGLLQWMPSSARLLGTTSEKLAAMTPTEQLPYVEASYRRWKGKLHNVGDTYLANFLPTLVGKPDSHVVSREGEPIYEQNPFPKATPGVLTVGDIRAVIVRRHASVPQDYEPGGTPSVAAGIFRDVVIGVLVAVIVGRLVR